jgi:hypothetical protein
LVLIKLNFFLEFADKSKYLASSMVNIDIVELANIDTFKESFPYTVNNFNQN